MKRFVFCVAPACLAFIALETVWRLFGVLTKSDWGCVWHGLPELQRFFFEDADKIIEKQGSFYVETEKALLKDDSLGAVIRNKYHFYKTKNPRIVIIGESAVYSVTTSAGESFPAFLEKMTGVETINFGRPGAFTSDFLTSTQPQAFKFNHTHQVFYNLSNDFFRPAVLLRKPDYLIHQLNAVLNRISFFYFSLYEYIWDNNSKELEARKNLYLLNMNRLVQNTIEQGVQPVLVKQALDLTYVSSTDANFLKYNKIYFQALKGLDELASQKNVPICNAASFFNQKSPAEKKRLFYDTVHLTALGNRELAAFLAAFFKTNQVGKPIF